VIVVGGFNSAIDKHAEIDRVEAGAVLRLRNLHASPGGKGLHVAMACATLGENTTLVGLIDEPHRGLFEGVLSRAEVTFAGIAVADSIRTCFALRDADGVTTELLEPGPSVPHGVTAALTDRFLTEARSAAMAVLSGSLPVGLAVDSYERLIRALDSGRVLVDASGDVLAASLGAAPLMVKPNRDEAAQLVGSSVDTWEAAGRAAALIASRGPTIVVISLGAQGACMHTAGQGFRIRAPAVDVNNPVGAGDCLLGGFAVGLVRGWPVEECARFAVACGSAKVRHPETGLMRAADVEALLRSIRVERVSG
jgi:1-phosphofructokinase family hexose kinase